MKQIKVLIAEDDVLIAEHLKTIFIKNRFQTIDLAHNKKDVLDKIINNVPDIVLLDIRMDTPQTGIEIAEYLMKNYDLPVIFLTALSDKRTIDSALKTNPYGYIVKPFKAAEVITSVKIALEKHSRNHPKQYILIKDGHLDVKLGLRDILYIKTDKNYIELHTKTKKYTVRQSLSDFLDNADHGFFYRSHKSYAVNINFVTELRSDYLLINTIRIPVSRTYYAELNAAFL